MPLIGIDLGTESSKVALARLGGIDIVANEFSKRATPSVISFTETERQSGETASNNLTFNYMNTVSDLKRLVGLKYSQVEDAIKRGEFPCKLVRGDNDEILVEVKYLGKPSLMSPVQVLAALFVKLRTITEKETNSKAGIDAVIAVPAYYTETQRRAVLQAAKIADLHVLRLINDVTAAAVGYGIYHKFEEEVGKVTNVAFIDVGHADTTVSIIAFSKGQLKVLSTACDMHLGAGSFERVLSDYFKREIKAKHGLDVDTNFKAKLRLQRESDKLKKVLGVNPVAQLRIEAFMNDIDIAFEIQRDTYNELCRPMAEQFQGPVQRALQEAGLTAADIGAVEVIGGGSYIPVLRDVLSHVFQQPVSQSLNAMEAIARGAALQGALLSPTFRLARRIEVIDAVLYPVNIGYKKNATTPDAMDVDAGEGANGDEKQMPIFKARDHSPSVKMITFTKNADFDLTLSYAAPDQVLVPHTDSILSKYTVVVPKREEPAKIKVKVKHSLNGLAEIESATMSEDIEVEETVPAPEEPKPAEAAPASPAPAAEAAAQPAADGAAPEAAAATSPAAEEPKPAEVAPAQPKFITRKVKKTITTNLSVVPRHLAGEASQEQMRRYIAEEQKMQAQDRLVQETAEAKNDVETFVYFLRDNLGDSSAPLGEFISDAERDTLMNTLDDVENWLYDYDGGENATKEEYVKKLAELKKAYAPVENRKKEDEGRSGVVNTLLNTVDNFKKFVDSKDEQYAHIEQADRGKVSAECDKVVAWLQETMDKQNQQRKYQEPVLTMDEVLRRDKYLRDVCNPIMNKPKPKPQPQPQPQPEAQAQPQPEQAASGAQQQPQQPEQPQEQPAGDQMTDDVD